MNVLYASNLCSPKKFNELFEFSTNAKLFQTAQKYHSLMVQGLLNNKSVCVTGFKTQAKLREYYKAGDLFVLPTREDVVGLVINEAMPCGLPIITTDRCVAGIERVRNYENGFIAPTEDADYLTRRIKALLSDTEMSNRMASKSIERIKSYIIEIWAQIYMRFFVAII